MPALVRRLSVRRKSAVDSSAFAPLSNSDEQRVRRSVFRRTASVPASTFNAIVKSTTKGARNLASVPSRRNCRVSDLSCQPPRMTPPSILKNPGARLTAFLTTVSFCPSARAVMSHSGDEFYYSPACGRFSAALTPCVSVTAMCSGMMGGLEGYDVYFPPVLEETGQRQGSQVTAMAVAGSQKGPWWSMLTGWWTTGEGWSSSDGSGKIEEIKGRRSVSPWLTIFQIFTIMFLTVLLYRNLESAWCL